MVDTKGRVLHKAAYVYDFLNPLFSFFQIKRLNNLAISFLDLKNSDYVLDIGCATGDVTLFTAKNFTDKCKGNVVGIDASKEMIECANKKKKNLSVSFQVCAAENLNFCDKYFDKAISTFFFHHLDYSAKVKAINEVYRVLKDDGKFVVLDIDLPETFFGKLVMFIAEFIFIQPEIGENRKGLLKTAMDTSLFKQVTLLKKQFGYISFYLLEK